MTRETKLIIQSQFCVAVLLFLICDFSFCSAQELVLYKQIDTSKLFLEVYQPPSLDTSKTYPAMVFFFGGAWKYGNRSQFLSQAEYFAKRGVVCFLADYRTESKNNTTPFQSLKDAKSAIRFIRGHASGYNIDSSRIIACGGSAGGHLAAATALIKKYDEESDDMSISCVPNALVLFNPVIDNGPGGYGYERIGEAYKDFSPLHNIKKGAPPTILFLGTNDAFIPEETAQYYKKVMEKVGSRCELRLYEGKQHGFFNYKNFDDYRKTLTEADQFLQSLGMIKERPIIKIE